LLCGRFLAGFYHGKNPVIGQRADIEYQSAGKGNHVFNFILGVGHYR